METMRRLFLPLYLLAAVVALVALPASLSGCMTTTALQSQHDNPKDYKTIATASCKDLQNAQLLAEAGVTWTRICFPNKEEVFKEQVDPITQQIDSGIQLYCQTAMLVTDVDSWQDLLTKKDDLMKLIGNITEIVRQVKR